MDRAARVMPNGLTRTLSWFRPYPIVFDHGQGATVHDVDGNSYVDLFSNGLSLMHGHAYEPVVDALRETIRRGSAWPGTSDAQVEFAELLCGRIPGVERVRFTNTGTEAMMLAVKLARHMTERPVIVKAWGAYHGSYDDLEVGLGGRAEEEGRVALATFGDLDSYAAALERNQGRVAAVVVEPVQYTGHVLTPADGFLPALATMAREAGALVVLDDCLMFRLAPGGSASRFGIEADITGLGKWVGGGLPVGAVGASAELMSKFDLDPDRPLYHGGSFNGNLLGMVTGAIAVRDLTAGAIGRLDDQARRLKEMIGAAAHRAGVDVALPGIGSVFGIYVLDADGEVDPVATSLLHLAAVTRGVYFGTGGEVGMCTALSDEEIARAADGIGAALLDLAAAATTQVG
ncbi:MAG: aminotransferase class III-fold pyridoxal phosphate-dependent enzyme [Actinobacteria bacterium]|nr:aminotransferase class III-fold pyridoxal phosphate-dependent enzyme [Actinomycetota bacterium]